MRILSAVVVTGLMLWVGLRYCWLTVTGQTDPVFAGWLVLTVSVVLAFWTYIRTDTTNLIDNIGNTVDLIVIGLIIGAIVFFGQNIRAGFTWFEVVNLVLAACIVVFWWWSKNPFASNLAIQVLMVIGYLPLIARVATAEKNPEPWSVWIPVWIATVLSVIPAFDPRAADNKQATTWKDTFLPKAYAVRATVVVTTLVLLMLRLELR